MSQPKSFVDRVFVKAEGAMSPHEIDALDALYPGLFDAVAGSVSERFAGKAVLSSQAKDVMRHVAALVVAELWKHLGSREPDADYRVQAAKQAAEDWLHTSKSIDEVRASAAPPPLPLSEVEEAAPRPVRMPTIAPPKDPNGRG